MKRVEIIGPSGVGKSRLYGQLSDLPKESRSYLTLGEAYKEGAVACNISVKKTRLYFYQALLRSGVVRKKEWGLGKVILLNNRIPSINDRNKFNSVSVSFDILMEYLKCEKRPYYVEKRVSRFLNKVNEYLLLEESLPGDEIVLIDEGMTTHHYPGITEFGFQNYDMNELRSDPVFSPLGIIYCTQAAEVIFEQAVKRRESGIKTFSHGHLNGTQLRKHIEMNIKKDEQKAESFKVLGVPVLEVNTGQDFIFNSDKIDDFIKGIGEVVTK